MKFSSEIKNSDISVYNIEYLDKQLKKAFGDKFDIKKYNYDTDYCLAYVDWYFYTEYRSWGVKEVGAYATRIDLDISVRVWECNGLEDQVKDIKICSDSIHEEFESWEIETEIDLKLGDCIQPRDIEVDCKAKTITIIF